MSFKDHTVTGCFRSLLNIGLMLAVTGLLSSCTWGWERNKEGDNSVQRNTTSITQRKIPYPRPNSHKANWLEYHGALADLNMNEAGQRGKTCLTCHERNDCIECHNTRPPRDHTNMWRTRSHGFMASGNSERCLTCHRQDYCVSCHNETAPRNHTGNWVERHCSWCHFGSNITPESNCVVCHRQAPHTSAPHSVNGKLDCTLCHN